MAIVPLIALVLESIGWRWMYRAMVGTMLLIGIPCSFTYKPPQKSPDTRCMRTTRNDEKQCDGAIPLKQSSDLENVEDECFKECVSNTEELEPLPKDAEVMSEIETMRSPSGRVILTPGFWMYGHNLWRHQLVV